MNRLGRTSRLALSVIGLLVAGYWICQGRALAQADGNAPAGRIAAPPNGPPKRTEPPLLIAPFGEKEAHAARKAWAQYQRIDEKPKNSLNMELVLIPAGRFSMGSPETADELMKVFPYAKKEWLAGERPVHGVTISRPFYLGKYEVTKGQFRKFVEDTGYKTDAEKGGNGGWGYTGDKAKPFEQRPTFTWRDWGVEEGDTSPVVNVSHNDAVAFSEWLSRKERKKYRLPTEAEWEYACRAGTTGRYYNGDDTEGLTKIGNVADATAKERFSGWTPVNSSDGWAFTSPVGQFAANNFGLYDMLGNVWEWCSDWHDQHYYTKSPESDPTGPNSGSARVARGGSWKAPAVRCRAAARAGDLPANRNNFSGFRVAQSSGESTMLLAEPAVTDQKSGERVEMAKALVGRMAAGQFQAAVEPFDTVMKKAVPPDELKRLWSRLAREYGFLQQATETRAGRIGGLNVVFVTCHFQKGLLDVKVVFNAQNQIAGLFAAPKETYRRPPYVSPSAFGEIPLTIGKGLWALPGTLSLPKGDGQFPAVVLVHGSGPNDRDETIGSNKPFRDLAQGLASRGIAVLRYEKRTRQHPIAMTLLSKITVREETIDDAVLAVDALATLKTIDPKRIFVLGHSLGGMLLPRIAAANSRIAGLVSLAGSTRPLEDLLLEQTKYVATLNGKRTDETRKSIEQFERKVNNVKSADLTKGVSPLELPLGVPSEYWLDLRGYDPAESAKKIDKPMLILQGGRDYQVTMDDFAKWKSALASRNDVKFILYPSLNHMFIEGRGKSVPAEYLVPGNVAEVVITEIAQWIQGQTELSKPKVGP